MNIFFNHVGLIGADAHFPLTIQKKIPIKEIENAIDNNNPIEKLLLKNLIIEFPSGNFNVWGVPSGANFVIKNLKQNDVVFLIESVNNSIHGSDGLVPYYGIVKVFIPEEFPNLSKVLWGESKFTYIFFFDAININLKWQHFRSLLNYHEQYNPGGLFVRIIPERLTEYGGPQGFMKLIDKNFINEEQYYPDEITEADLFEGTKKTVTVNAYERNLEAREKCLVHYGYQCAVCGFIFKELYGDIGDHYIHIHHKKPLSEISERYVINPIEDLIPICPNCHAMLHRKRPPYSIEELKKIINKEN